jgi:hypothetical protein
MISPFLHFLIACSIIGVLVSAVAGLLVLLRPRWFQEQRRLLPRDP